MTVRPVNIRAGVDTSTSDKQASAKLDDGNEARKTTAHVPMPEYTEYASFGDNKVQRTPLQTPHMSLFPATTPATKQGGSPKPALSLMLGFLSEWQEVQAGKETQGLIDELKSQHAATEGRMYVQYQFLKEKNPNCLKVKRIS